MNNNLVDVKLLTPIQAIREKCIDCCAGDKNEVRLCESITCPQFLYRMGRRPKQNDVDDLRCRLEMRYSVKKHELAKQI